MASAQHKFKIDEGALKKVTVFNDRAELKREFTVELTEGLNEVTIEPFSRLVIDDSVRVTGRGPAVIEEVQIVDRRTTTGSRDSDQAAAIRKEKEDLELTKQRLEYGKSSAEKRLAALDQMVGEVGNGLIPKKEKFVADQETLEGISTFFLFYDEQMLKLRSELREKQKEIERLTQLIQVKENELRVIDHGVFTKQVIVLLEASAAGSVLLEVSYQLHGAGWQPIYDMRVQTKEGKSQMQLSYYANVHQSSGELWEGAQLILSTARPCLGGNIPELGTLDVSFKQEVVAYAKSSGGLFGSVSGRASQQLRSTGLFSAAPQAVGFGGPMVHREAAVSEQALSTEFAITRPCSIPADGAMHKVTIGTIELAPQLVHESVPSKAASAFLTATAVNSSSLPILPGQASVYLDGAFVAKSRLKAVSPGERFTASLGVDPAVRIEYKPAHKYHEQTGLISKWSSTVTDQKIVVRNTRGDAVLLTIREQIPRSTDEKIKVKVVSPEVMEKVTEEAHLTGDHTPKVGTRLLPSNNLEWTVSLPKGGSQTLTVKYAIDFPSSEKLDFASR